MPQPSIIIPIIVTGIIVGSIMTGKKIRKKRLLIASLISGLLNAGYGYVLYLVAPPPTFTYRGTGGAGFTGGTGAAARAASGGGELVFVISSFLAGFLIVLATIGIALVYARYRKKPDDETEAPAEPEESPELQESREPEESEALDLEKPSKKSRK